MPNKNYNQKIHNRRSIRLKNYDYASDGAYFMTICVQNKEHRFGDVIDGKMILNSAGEMIRKWLFELKNKFENVELDEYIIMPNHIHLIIFIMNIVGVDLCVNPDLCANPEYAKKQNSFRIQDRHTGDGISQIVQWFKTMTTNEYIRNVKQNNWKPFDKKIWQRNYYDRIIRNEKELDKIRKYIFENPLKWELDKSNPENLFM
ncbi:MAG: transposase [Patescibacteria group bacterium]|nr:transposase [Patescibacteria group bacterium]